MAAAAPEMCLRKSRLEFIVPQRLKPLSLGAVTAGLNPALRQPSYEESGSTKSAPDKFNTAGPEKESRPKPDRRRFRREGAPQKAECSLKLVR